MREHAISRTLRESARPASPRWSRSTPRRLHPELTREQAFTKVFTADNARAARSGARGRSQSRRPLDDDEPSEEAEDVEDDALEELNALAAQKRRRNPKLTKPPAFTKVYSDPANAKLAQASAGQIRPR